MPAVPRKKKQKNQWRFFRSAFIARSVAVLI
jgi:hypothetical protein